MELWARRQLALVPAAGQTRWKLRSDWPHPSFIGRFLPQQREVTDQGFQARWAVNSLASSAARDALRSGRVCNSTPIALLEAGDAPLALAPATKITSAWTPWAWLSSTP